MNSKIKNLYYMLWLVLVSSSAYADCTFRVVNYSFVPVTVEAGFFDGTSKVTFITYPSSFGESLVKNNKLCTAVSKAGLGLAYMNLVGGKSKGGWVYAPVNDQIKAVGLRANALGCVGIGTNGSIIYLKNTIKPSADRFTGVIKTTKSSSRQNGSLYY